MSKIITANMTDPDYVEIERDVKLVDDNNQVVDVFDRVTVTQGDQHTQVIHDHKSNTCEVYRGRSVKTYSAADFFELLGQLGKIGK